jgi:hypothetical protein
VAVGDQDHGGVAVTLATGQCPPVPLAFSRPNRRKLLGRARPQRAEGCAPGNPSRVDRLCRRTG